MSSNPNRIIIELMPSDRVHSRDDAHLARIVKDTIEQLVNDHWVAQRVASIRVERSDD